MGKHYLMFSDDEFAALKSKYGLTKIKDLKAKVLE